MTNKIPILVDSHCHIHASEYDFVIKKVLAEAKEAGISKMICVGADSKTSHEAVEFCLNGLGQPDCYFSLALHPHEAAKLTSEQLESEFEEIRRLAHKHSGSGKLVAIGECGLDYFYHDSKEVRLAQAELLRWHLDIAKELDLPLIFHVREAFDDFWPIYDEYKTLGVLHSFSDTVQRVDEAVDRGTLFFGLNGIMTFTKQEEQLEAARRIPLEKLMLETDAPYLTPEPLRGTINTPANVRLVANFLSDLRGEASDLLADQTTANARQLFGI
ncbi:MAG: TatD family hydrolase [Patescibacteria group bacterium]